MTPPAAVPARSRRWPGVMVFVFALGLAATAGCNQEVPLGVDPGLDGAASTVDAGAADDAAATTAGRDRPR